MAAKIHIKNDRINSFGGIFRQPWAHLRGLEAPAGGRRGYLRILGFEKIISSRYSTSTFTYLIFFRFHV